MLSNSMSLLLGFFIAILPITGLLMALTPYLMPKQECFAVTVPNSAMRDPYLRGLKRKYLLYVGAITVAVTVADIAALAFISEAACIVVFVVGILLELFFGYGLMLRSRSKVRKYKCEQGWAPVESRTNVFVGDEPFPQPISLKWNLLYIPVVLITIAIGMAAYGSMPDRIPMQIGFDGQVTTWADKSPGVVAFPVLLVVFLATCLAFCHWTITRSKKGVDSAQPAASAWAYGMFARAQSILLVAMGLVLSLMGPLLELVFAEAIGMEQAIVVILVMLAITLIASFAVNLLYGQNGSRLISRVEGRGELLRDDDEHWKLGIFYVNRDDASLFLPERFGIGWTINWGRPAALAIVAGFTALMILFVGVMLLLV